MALTSRTVLNKLIAARLINTPNEKRISVAPSGTPYTSPDRALPAGDSTITPNVTFLEPMDIAMGADEKANKPASFRKLNFKTGQNSPQIEPFTQFAPNLLPGLVLGAAVTTGQQKMDCSEDDVHLPMGSNEVKL